MRYKQYVLPVKHGQPLL